MSVILCRRIIKKEFPNGISENEKIVILRNAKKETSSAIKGKNLPAGTTLIKAYATSENGARRIVYLLQNANDCFVLLFYRDKKDKLGANITVKNKLFEKELIKSLDYALKDIEENNFIILE